MPSINGIKYRNPRFKHTTETDGLTGLSCLLFNVGVSPDVIYIFQGTLKVIYRLVLRLRDASVYDTLDTWQT